MRVFFLSVVLAFFLSATLVPVPNVVVRVGPQCLPSVDWQGRGAGVFPKADSTALSSYNLEDRDYLIRTIAFEAAHEPALGKAARPCYSQSQKEWRMGPQRQRDRHSALAV